MIKSACTPKIGLVLHHQVSLCSRYTTTLASCLSQLTLCLIIGILLVDAEVLFLLARSLAHRRTFLDGLEPLVEPPPNGTVFTSLWNVETILVVIEDP